ncbi:Hypothetical protein DHA2_10889 [Giardia duodenalis]|uniref:Uncharacterized protein n=1 Tax=Giardia intestinalis TaxID=5741 RepID=V6TAI8_GIAIN|nr:Hypothetical protein DHA2_10889 [Giardia intestinalis]
MGLGSISWFYKEPQTTTVRLFDVFAQGRDYITRSDIRRALAGLKLTPTADEVSAIYREVEELSSMTHPEVSEKLVYPMFEEMRHAPPFTPLYSCTLNILAEYMKYNCAYIHRGYVTEDSIETALLKESKSPEFIDNVKRNLLQLSFNVQFKLVSVRELYCFMKQIIPNNWRQYICESILENVPISTIVESLCEVGFNENTVIETVRLIASEGMVSAFPAFLEKTSQAVFHIYQ